MTGHDPGPRRSDDHDRFCNAAFSTRIRVRSSAALATENTNAVIQAPPAKGSAAPFEYHCHVIRVAHIAIRPADDTRSAGHDNYPGVPLAPQCGDTPPAQSLGDRHKHEHRPEPAPAHRCLAHRADQQPGVQRHHHRIVAGAKFLAAVGLTPLQVAAGHHQFGDPLGGDQQDQRKKCLHIDQRQRSRTSSEQKPGPIAIRTPGVPGVGR